MPKRIPPLFGLLALAASFISVCLSPAGAQDDTWSVSAANWMQYWYNRPEPFDSITGYTLSRRDSLDNRFIVDFDLGDFYAGAWLRIFQPNLPDESYERFAQRYLGWSQDGLTVHAGNFYQTFDRGLTLNAFLDDVVYFDNNLDGIKVSGLYDHYEFDAFSARGLKFRTLDRVYSLRGVRGALKPIVGIKAGASYVRFKQNDMMEFGKADNLNITGINGEINRGPISLYGEYATRRGRDEFQERSDGDGTYASASFSHSLFGIYGEYKNIINLLYPSVYQPAFNTPPPASHSGRSLMSKYSTLGERGYQLGSLITPYSDLNFDLAYSESFSRGQSPVYYLAEKFAGARWSPFQRLVLSYRWNRWDFTIEDEIENYFETYFYLDASQSVSATAYTHRYIATVPPKSDNHEDFLTLGYARHFLQLNLGGSITSREQDRLDPKRLAFIELTLRFRSHELVIFQGGERGGLICSSGICSFRPTFQGTRIILFSRF